MKRNIEQAQSALSTILGKHPGNAPVAARLAILVHARGGNVQKVFDQYRDGGGRTTPLLQTLSEIYAVPATGTAKVSGSSVKDDTSALAPASSENGKVAVITAGLPEGWYRSSALLALYAKDNPGKAQRLIAASDSKLEKWRGRYVSYQSVRLAFCAAGLLALFLFLRKRNDSREPAPASFSFRKVYGCLLITVYSQFLAGMVMGTIVGFCVGLSKALPHAKFDFSNFAPVFLAIVIVVGTATALLSIHFFVCRPSGTSVFRFFCGDQKPGLKRFLYECGGWFCVIVVLNTLLRWGLVLLPGTPRGTGSELHSQMVDSVVSANVGMIWWYVIVICLFAPVTEELLFRGLLYPWLRCRWGVSIALFVSSLAFAGWHGDMSGIPQYLAIGLTLAVVYERTRSLPIAAGTHALWNGYVMASLAWLASST